MAEKRSDIVFGVWIFWMTWALTESIVSTMPYHGAGWHSPVLALISAAFWILLLRRVRVAVIVFSSAGILTCLGWLWTGTRASEQKIADYFTDWAGWVQLYVTDQTKYEPRAALLTLALAALGLGLISTLFLLPRHRTGLWLMALSGLALLMVQDQMKWLTGYYSFWMFLAGIVAGYLLMSGWEARMPERGWQMLFAGLTAGIAVFVVLWLPKSARPVSVPVLDTQVMKLENTFDTWWQDFTARADGVGFDVSNGLYSLNGESLRQGNNKPDTRVMLMLRSPVRLYLRAGAMDVYDNGKWTRDPASPETNELPASGNTGYLADAIPGLNLSDFFVSYNITVEHRQIRTSSLFTGENFSFLRFSQSGATLKFRSYDQSLLSDRMIKRYTPYTMMAYLPDMDKLPALLRQTGRGLDQRLAQQLRAGVTTDIQTQNDMIRQLDALTARSEFFYTHDTAVPESLRQPLQTMARAMTRNARTDYDRVKAIEKAVSERGKYNLNPPVAPADKDPVMFFLTESHEGYCTHFASSMVLLCRSLGIPARMAEGFLPGDASSEEVYEMTGERAHAWPEVFFEGIGWIGFEPTASFTRPSAVEATGASDSAPAPVPTPPEETNRFLQEDGDLTGDGTSATAPSVPRKLSPLLVLLLPVGWLVWRQFASRRFRRKVRQGDREAMLALYPKVLDILRLWGYGMKEGETPLEHAARVDHLIGFGQVRLQTITAAFCAMFYGSKEGTSANGALMAMFMEDLLKQSKGEIGGWKYHWHRWVTGKVRW